MSQWSELVQGALAALPRSEETVHLLGEAGLSRAEWSSLVLAHLCEPPVHLEALAVLVPYASQRVLQARLDALCARHLLQEVAVKEYILTDKAADLLTSWLHRERTHLSQCTPLVRRDLERLAALLERVVQAALVAPPPPDKQRLLSSRRIAPSADAGLMVQIDQYLTDLFWFRDDAHVAAWRYYDLDGPSVEVLTLLWRGEARGLDGISGALTERRGYSRDEYAGFVERLAESGLVDASQPELVLTPAGRALRDQVEETTESYYMFPWTVLSPVELKQLRNLLQEFTQGLQTS